MQDRLPSSSGEVDVEQYDIGDPFIDQLDGGIDVIGLSDDIDRVAQLGPNPGSEHGMVVDQEDPRPT